MTAAVATTVPYQEPVREPETALAAGLFEVLG